MNRRNFLRLASAAVATTIVAPKLLIPKEQPVKPIRWIDKAEWEFSNQWLRDQDRVFRMYTGRQGKIDFDQAVRDLVKYYEKDSLTTFLNKVSL